MDAAQVGIQPEAAGHMPEHMGVGIDHARDHQPAGYVDPLARREGTAVRLDGGHPAAADGDVVAAVESLCRVDQVPAGQCSIEHHHSAFAPEMRTTSA